MPKKSIQVKVGEQGLTEKLPEIADIKPMSKKSEAAWTEDERKSETRTK